MGVSSGCPLQFQHLSEGAGKAQWLRPWMEEKQASSRLPWSRESLGFWVLVAALQLWETAEVWGWSNKQWGCFWRRRKCSVVATVLKYAGMKKFTDSCLVAKSYVVNMEGSGINVVQWHWPGKPSQVLGSPPGYQMLSPKSKLT